MHLEEHGMNEETQNMQTTIPYPLYEDNLHDFEQLVGENPAEAYRQYGLTLIYGLKEEDVVRERYRLGAHPVTGRDLYNLGVLCSEQSEHTHALKWYEAAESAGADFPDLFYNLFVTWTARNSTAKARRYAEAYVEAARKALAETEDKTELEEDIRAVRAWLRQNT
jgi:hypothetical protein